ncbi:DUF5682 family protein [Klebsiella aerogenes]|uniref:DUF5682 family protein n=1 Tax=Klebsiella aerogenes TaxID=548 RepID=UPI002DBF25A3|nr:DUF5682 family protein [Klebsiella aerogenes]MEB5696020.1 DUF5682 family protein [Klebsiella aerogenes]
MSEQPLIIGIRHHSPACAALVKESILAVHPRYVLIEGLADFNRRIEELFLPHQLPVAIYSYSQSTDDTTPGRGAWTPFAEYSPEWQALMAAKEIGAQTRFIDLPAWAQTENDDDDSQARQRADRQRLLQASGMENSDTLWDHLFEDESQRTTLASALEHYFFRLRDGEPGGENSRQREAYMTRWLAWAMQQNDGPVVVVCGGWHAPALAASWRDCPAQAQEPALPQPGADAVTGCYLTPYSEKRLDVLSGYLSGMPAPVWQSGSMVDSVIHSAVMAACLWQLPGIRTHLVAFDTEVVDLTADVADPVELLMKVQLGGGTHIARAVEYACQLIEQPAKSVIVLVSDFFEGGTRLQLIRQVKQCVRNGSKVLGLAVLDSNASPSYDHDTAQALVNAGAQIAAMTPGELAAWLAENLQS